MPSKAAQPRFEGPWTRGDGHEFRLIMSGETSGLLSAIQLRLHRAALLGLAARNLLGDPIEEVRKLKDVAFCLPATALALLGL